MKNASLLRNKVNGDGKKTEKEETVREELSNPYLFKQFQEVRMINDQK